LAVKEKRDVAGLRQRLLDTRPQVGLTRPPENLLAVANELLRLDWEHRWPKRPRWLARRLHGEGLRTL
jgi:hypothetical protein